MASWRTRGPIDKISFGAPFWPVTNHSCSDTSLLEPGFEVDPTGPGQTTLVSPRARGSWQCAVPAQYQTHHGECHDNVYYPKQSLSPEGRFCRDCLLLDAINAFTRLPSPEWDVRIKVRLDFLVCFDFQSEVLRVARHTVGPFFLHCRWITEQQSTLIIGLLNRWREAESFPLPRNVHGSVFYEKMRMLPLSLLISSVGNVPSWKRVRSIGVVEHQV